MERSSSQVQIQTWCPQHVMATSRRLKLSAAFPELLLVTEFPWFKTMQISHLWRPQLCRFCQHNLRSTYFFCLIFLDHLMVWLRTSSLRECHSVVHILRAVVFFQPEPGLRHSAFLVSPLCKGVHFLCTLLQEGTCERVYKKVAYSASFPILGVFSFLQVLIIMVDLTAQYLRLDEM